MTNEIDPKVRAIYHLMLNDRVFVEHQSAYIGLSTRYISIHDIVAAEAIYQACAGHVDVLEIAKRIAGNL